MTPYALSRVATTVGLTLLATTTATAQSLKPTLMDRDTEIAEALAAGPPIIRDEAGVYVLTEGGYELARESRNGFHCLVGKSQPDSFEPQCLDAEGSKTLLKQILLRGERQMRGDTAEQIQEAIDAAWASGELTAPAKSGINYMLSTKNRVPVGGRVIDYVPHLMFYAPGLSESELGADRTGEGSPIFMVNPGQPTGYVIVPLPDYDD